ncbi:MAG TPA: hypothetical protein VG860_14780 [Terriglobia bacterium]|jgi:hypothetical protein|nr:hypothetical protein [Terriglobia bacterium]
MAKPSQTFKKRQREQKLREKAQLKRERRQQRQTENKANLMSGNAAQSADQDLEPAAVLEADVVPGD